MKHLYVTDRDQWRDWLSQHHDGEVGIWLVFYKKGTSEPTIEYEAAVEEAPVEEEAPAKRLAQCSNPGNGKDSLHPKES